MVTAPIPRFMLPHTVTLVKKTGTDGWGGDEVTTETVVNFVRVEPCRSQRFSLGGDIPEIRAKLFFDTFSSVPCDACFEVGDGVRLGGADYVVAEVQTFYAASDRAHHLEVLLR